MVLFVLRAQRRALCMCVTLHGVLFSFISFRGAFASG